MSDEVTERALLHRGGTAGAWGNLGLWPADDYGAACAALARAVGRAALLAPGQRVLSLACGAGDELALWIDEFGAAHALGIDRDGALTDRAPPHPQTTLRTGDAAQPELGAASLDVVLCVDAAYHFAPRAAWLAAVRRTLQTGGRLAFTDLVLDRATGTRALLAPLLRPLMQRGAAGAGIDLSEVVSDDEATARVAATGFVDVQIDRLDEAVLGGFARFVAAQTRRLGADAKAPGWRRPRATAALIRPCRAAGLGYALLSATAA